jgi:hypothetical protein
MAVRREIMGSGELLVRRKPAGFSKKSNHLSLITIALLIVLVACTGTKKPDPLITDLNGTWLPDWMYELSQDDPEDEIDYYKWEFSWGTGLRLHNFTFSIDMTADFPMFIAPCEGGFNATDIKKTGVDSITMLAYRGDLNGPEEIWKFTIEFRFIDKDTIWIKCDALGESSHITDETFWHRLSGP